MDNKSHQQSDNRWVLRNDGQEVRTLWRLWEGWVQAVHVIAPVTVITKQQLVLQKQKQKNEKKDVTTVYQSAIYTLDKVKNLTKQKESSIYISVYV